MDSQYLAQLTIFICSDNFLWILNLLIRLQKSNEQF
jgi:hypothetical protein